MKKGAISIGNKVNSGGTVKEDQFHPNSLNTICPHCTQNGTFSLKPKYPTPVPDVWPTFAVCPACNKRVNFVLYYFKGAKGKKPVDISMFPAPSISVKTIELPPGTPASLVSAIRDAEASLRAGLFSPTVTCAGRALEGLLKHFSQKPDKPLIELIDQFCDSTEVGNPIRVLSHTMRKGRNVAAHFDERIQPDKESAEIMVELLHYLISYLFLFSEKAEKLSTKLN